MKLTMSKDGKMRFSVRVEYRVSYEMLHVAICDMIYLSKEISKAKVIKFLRSALSSGGYDHWDCNERHDKHTIKEASRLMEWLFPEMEK